MATFKAIIKKDKIRADKTWNVLIRFTHDRKVRYISTTMYVSKKDITAGYNIKNVQVIDKCNELIKAYSEKIKKLNLELNYVPIDDIIDFLKTTKEDKSGIDFIAFSRKWCAAHTEIKGIKNYITSLNSFCVFLERNKVSCEEVTAKVLKTFEESLKEHPRAQSLYISSIIRLFNEAKLYYNDEDNGIIRIKHSLDRYKIKQQNVAAKRAITEEEIKKIFGLPYIVKTYNGHKSRRDLAKDCFMLSFSLMGMNSADLFTATEYDGKFITYNRQKTKDRRNDGAKMVVRVNHFIRPIIEKYLGEERVFNFYERFSSKEDFNRSINMGLKDVGKELGIENLQFYAARHSMATIAVNKVGISKYIVNDMLNHTDSSLKVTELYIEKDFKPINAANFKLLHYMFGKKFVRRKKSTISDAPVITK